MSKFLIEGSQPLRGEVEIKGAKNSAMKIIAAAILAKGEYLLENIPRISDVMAMLEILEYLGAKILFKQNTLKINTIKLGSKPLPQKLTGQLRGSIVVIGALLARFGKAQISYPGGCQIGARPIDTHLEAFRQLGAEIKLKNNTYHFQLKKPIGRKIVLPEMSVTATENIILASLFCEGQMEIHIAACEPEIQDLIGFLNKMGAEIKGGGTNIITIKGVKKLAPCSWKIIPDRLEAITFLIAIAITKGEGVIKRIIPEHLELVFLKLKQAGVKFELVYTYKDKKYADIYVLPSPIFSAINLDTRPYPSFPTDLQAPMAILMTQAKGVSKIFETLFENRFGYLGELKKMGASVSVKDNHTALITGSTPLYGKKIVTLDLRAGATLILAALIAHGETTISKVEIIDRGYEAIEKRLQKLGAKIKRI